MYSVKHLTQVIRLATLLTCCSTWCIALCIPVSVTLASSIAWIVLLVGRNSSISIKSNSHICWASFLEIVGSPGATRYCLDKDSG